MVEVYSLLSSTAVHPSSSLLPPKLQAWCRCYLLFLTTLHTIMFSKATLTFLAIGVLSVNALTTPVARSPAPESECKFPRSSSITSYHNLALVSFNSPRTRGQNLPVLTRAPHFGRAVLA